MKGMLSFLLLIGFSFDFGHKCDTYFVGNVVRHYLLHDTTKDEFQTIQGCKKGCYWNSNYTEDGIPKCGKCSEIKDEIECLSHTATCQWSGGKCKSQSCPNIAKSRVTLRGGNNDNDTRESRYRDQVIKEQECIEGSALEKKYNTLYINDLIDSFNFRYHVYNTPDYCANPGSKIFETTVPVPYAWANVVGDNANANKLACEKYIGYVYTADGTIPRNDLCTRRIDCFSFNTKTTCESNAGCIYVPEFTDGTGTGVCEFADGTSCTRLNNSPDPRWTAGTNTSADCTKVVGCIFVPGQEFSGGYYARNKDGLLDSFTSSPDRCIPGCGPFTAGTHTRKDCEVLGCTYSGGDMDLSNPDINRTARPGLNLKTFEDADLCPNTNHPPTNPRTYCQENEKLEINHSPDVEACNDKIYDQNIPFQCSDSAYTTEESCKNAYETWTPVTKECRTLYSTERSLCEFAARDLKNNEVYKDLKRHGGNLKMGTAYEKCVQDHYDEVDLIKSEKVVGFDGKETDQPAFLTPDDHEKIYGYRTPEEWCQRELDFKLAACQRQYDASVTGCHQRIENERVTIGVFSRTESIQIKADRSACHRIYGCMYSRSNERCSVWAVWAYILILILTIVVFVAVAAVGGIVLLRVFGLSSA